MNVLLYRIVFFISVLFLLPHQSIAQEENPEYEEILVSFIVGGIGNAEIPAVIKGDSIYLPVTEIFNFLRIKNDPSVTLDSVSGFFLNQDAVYLIDKTNNVIRYNDSTLKLNPSDIIRTETGLYLRSVYFGKVFQLNAAFNFRALLVKITTKLELPVIREAKLAAIRNNINKLKGEMEVDREIPRDKSIFHFGNLDWSVISTQQSIGGNETRVGLGLGGMLAGGELNALLNYSTVQPFQEKQQYYMWRHVNNDNKAVRQVSIGKIFTPTIASVFAPLVGFQVSNTPTIVRYSFGSYVLSNITQPGWTVELYVNSVLIDYVQADAKGYFSFNVPLVYGNSIIQLKYYGPFGEQEMREENIRIPFNILPDKKFEYTVTGGVVEDDSSSKFSRAAGAYGLTKTVTIGGGAEYHSSVRTGPVIPFVNTSARLSSRLLFAGEYAYGVRGKGVISYRLPSNMQFELYYTRYKKGQKAIVNSFATEERKMVLSVPIATKNFSLFSLITINQLVMPNTKYTTGEWMLASLIRKVDTRISTYAVYANESTPFIYCNISLGYRLPYNIYITPQAQYDFNNKELISLRGVVEKKLFKTAILTGFYERNFKSNFYNAGLQFRYDLPFAQVGFIARQSNSVTSLLESARGSVIYDNKTNYLAACNKVNVSRGGVVVSPFLDVNCNGIREPEEPKLSGLKFRSNGGQQIEGKDTTIRLENLEPYSKLYLELNRFSFDNIAWQIKNLTIGVTVQPNVFSFVEVPVSVVAEASGTVTFIRNDVQKGQGQISVCFYQNNRLIAKTLSEPDGYFSYIGLTPGDYMVAIDTAQLRRINMVSSPGIPITIVPNPEGDVIDDIQFELRPLQSEEEKKQGKNRK